MNDDRLEELLRHADADLPAPRLPDDLVARVLRRARQRRYRRVTVTSAAAAILLAVGLSWPLLKSPPAQPTPGPGVLVAEISALRAEAQSRVAVARRVKDLQAQDAEVAARPQPPAVLDPLLAVRLETDQTAILLVKQADGLANLDSRQSAAELYRRVIDLFPDAPSATRAREHLKILETTSGDLL